MGNWDWAGIDVQVITINGISGESQEAITTFEGIVLGLRDKHVPILHALLHSGNDEIFIQIILPDSGTNVAENFLADEGFECLISEAKLMEPRTKQ